MMRRGEIRVGNLHSNTGREIGKIRPVLVVSDDRLLKACDVVVEQIRPLDSSRISEGPLTTLSPDEMASVEKSLRAVLGLW